jgi:circadian clock protein KaiB
MIYEIDQPNQLLNTEEIWELILFVAGDNGSIQTVRKRLESTCRQHLGNHYRIDVVDIAAQPERASDFDIIAIPTLLRNQPKPVRRIIGDLSLTHKVLQGLGLPFEDINS